MEVDTSFDNFILFLWGRDEAIAAEEFRKLVHTSVRRRIVSSSLGAAVCSNSTKQFLHCLELLKITKRANTLIFSYCLSASCIALI